MQHGLLSHRAALMKSLETDDGRIWDHELVAAVMKIAGDRTGDPGMGYGCLFHSDRGSQYCYYTYQKKLQAHGLRPSMGGKGNCYDNASVETFFKSLKAELIWRQKWLTRPQAEAAIFQYINGLQVQPRSAPLLHPAARLADASIL